MANVKFIAVSRGLRGIVDYVTNREKTVEQLISGVNCLARTAVPEFEAAKKQFRKTEGRGYYHIVQAFAPDDPLDFATAHELGVKLAEHFAKENKCLGLITGESIGQVASQTMQSLAATNEVCTMPVYRPLIGFDKQEIVEISEKIDAYETSILPYEDCCTIFVAKHPVTKPSLNVIHNDERKLSEKIDALMQEAIDTVEVIHIEA